MNINRLALTTTNSEIIKKLSHNRDWTVRYHVAENPNTSSDTLNFLSRDEQYWVRNRVAHNSNTSFETLKQMAIHDKFDCIREDILENPNCPNELYMYIEGRKLLKTLSKSST